MLKGKKAIYILIPVNLLIWGFLAFKIFDAFSVSDYAQQPHKKSITHEHFSNDSATYELRLSYDDPFLKDIKKQRNSLMGKSETSPKRVAIPPKKPTVPSETVPEVKYIGLIKNNLSGKSSALVFVNGESRLIKANETVNGIIFKSFNKDSLVAKWGKEVIIARK